MAEPSDPLPELRPSRLAKLRDGWSGGSWRRGLIHLVVLLGVSVAASYAISPGLYGQQIPQLRDADVGKPYRAQTLKASRDYQIINVEATHERRQDARASVKPV